MYIHFHGLESTETHQVQLLSSGDFERCTIILQFITRSYAYAIRALLLVKRLLPLSKAQ